MTPNANPADRVLLTAGGMAALLFCGVSTYEMLTRPGFDLDRHAISMLSLGERGWVMTATFIISGILTLLCAIGLRRTLVAGRRVPILIGLYGIGLVLAGIFPATAALGFPPGTPDNQQPAMTPSAIVHGIGFMLAFGSLTIACFVMARRLSGGWSMFSLSAGIIMPTLIALGMANIVAPGIAFFVAAIVAWAWLTVIVMRLADQSSGPAQAAAPSRA